MRLALKKAKIIFFGGNADGLLLKKLNIATGIFVPIIWDTDYFKPDDSNLIHNTDFTIFHPTNLNWKIKGNDILIKAFAEFVKISPYSILIIVDRGIDSDNTHKLVEKLQLTNKVKFLKGPLTYSDLKRNYLLSDVIADQFILSDLGGISCESLACGKPVLVNCPANNYENLHDEEPPILHSKNVNDILKNLQILQDEKLRKNLGLKGRDWIVKHHSPNVVISKIHLIYPMIIEGKTRQEILKEFS